MNILNVVNFFRWFEYLSYVSELLCYSLVYFAHIQIVDRVVKL